jgi:hypothetical protein
LILLISIGQKDPGLYRLLTFLVGVQLIFLKGIGDNMKNVLVYITPNKCFDKERELLARIQIDNSLELGWKPEDILIVTNYDYEYNGVKSVYADVSNFCASRPRSIKTSIVPYLIDHGIVKPGEIYWDHDFDAYQMSPITDEELGLDGFDGGLTDYGWRPRWCMGSYFFKDTAKDVFQKARDIVFKDIEDETAFVELTQDPKIAKRFKRMNITYNFGMRNVEINWKIATQPIRVVHFHPWYRWVNTLDIFMYGKNPLGFPILNDRLKKLLVEHGVK